MKKKDKETNMLVAYVILKTCKIYLHVSINYSNLTPSHRTRMAKHIRKKAGVYIIEMKSHTEKHIVK